ncbi:MAG: hypothetical protein JSS34_01720 [Proteobacteria bacterium]|nr:hypothetical protein [Pseudomonadota bacterium]
MIKFVHIKEVLSCPQGISNFFYIGVNTENLLNLERKGIQVNFLSKERKILLDNFQEEIINLDKHVLDILDPLWLASDLAENNLCLENFSLYILNTFALLKMDLLNNEDVIFICDDDEQVYIYASLLRKNGFKIIAHISYLKLLKRLTGHLFQKVCYFCQSLYNILYLHFLRYYCRSKIQTRALEKSDVLCINWVGESSFTNNDLFLNDRYFGDLLSKLADMRFKVSIVGKPLNFIDSFKKIAKEAIKQKNNFYLLQDFLKISDLFKLFFKSFYFLKYYNHPFKMEGIDFSSLWKWFCLKDTLKYRLLHALEVYTAATTLFTFLKNPSVKLIYPFENQPWEKVLSLAFKKVLPTHKIYAYQHFPFAKEYLTAYFSDTYIHEKMGPSLLLSDTFFKNWIEKRGTKDCSLFGNFRFQRVLKNSQFPVNSHYKKKVILCACSIQFYDSLELISTSIKIIKKLKPSLQKNVTLVINFHPLISPENKEKIQNFFSNPGIDLEWSPLSADELLEKACLVFYNSNSICFNAAARGIPAVFMNSDLQIDLDRIPDISIKGKDISDVSQKVEKLIENVHYYQDQSKKFKSYFDIYYKAPDYSRIHKLFTEGK